MLRNLAVLGCILACAYPQGPKVPRFEDYPVSDLFHGPPAKPQFSKAKNSYPDSDERYRFAIELDAKGGPNFSGHYTIVRWSCGTGCSSMLVLDAKTGELYRKSPYSTLDINGNAKAADRMYKGLSYRENSSLLIVEGCFEAAWRRAKGKQQDCARKFYKWEEPDFVLLRSDPLR